MTTDLGRIKLLDSPARYKILAGDRWSLVRDIELTIQNYGKYLDYDALSLGQLESKEWLIKELEEIGKPLGTVYVLCGWYGILPALMFYADLEIDKIRSFDIDDECHKIADSMNKTNCDKEWRFKAITQDIFDINFREHSWQCWSNKNNRMSYPITDKPETIINTSCEHVESDWFSRVPIGKFVILQSSDSFIEEGHINAMTSMEEFKDAYPLRIIKYEGQKEFEKYNRLMLIGIK